MVDGRMAPLSPTPHAGLHGDDEATALPYAAGGPNAAAPYTPVDVAAVSPAAVTPPQAVRAA
eukprot:5183311-Prymnesium_polylepis.1